jgi:CRP-like cAMP-binding protein
MLTAMASGPQPLVGPGGLEAVLDRAWNRPSAKDWADVIARLPLFARVSKRHLRKIAGLAEFAQFDESEMVIQAGEPGDAFYLILSGRAKVLGKPRTLRTGDYFGEMALLDGGARTATITADGELRCATMTSWDFKSFVLDNPKVAWSLLQSLAQRLRESRSL